MQFSTPTFAWSCATDISIDTRYQFWFFSHMFLGLYLILLSCKRCCLRIIRAAKMNPIMMRSNRLFRDLWCFLCPLSVRWVPRNFQHGRYSISLNFLWARISGYNHRNNLLYQWNYSLTRVPSFLWKNVCAFVRTLEAYCIQRKENNNEIGATGISTKNENN